MPKENRTKYAILGMLDLTPMSGYDIKKYCDMSVGYFWNEDYGHIYPTLKSLLDEGLASKEVVTTGSGPTRHLYTITAAGKDELSRWLPEAPARPNIRIELLLKVFFGSRLETERLLTMVKEELEAARSCLADFDATERHLQAHIEAGGTWAAESRHQLMSLNYGRHYYRAVAAWAEETMAELRVAGRPGADTEGPGTASASPA